MLPGGMSIPEHHSSEAAPGDRGRGLGVAQRDRIGRTADLYLRLFATKAGLDPETVIGFGGEAQTAIAAVAPALADEIEGIADGAGLPVELVAALNARTEVLASGRGECTTVACLGTASEQGTPLGVQTWDWHDDLAGCWMRWTIDHGDGRRVETMTEAGIVGKVGVNGAGVAVLLNILGHRDDGPPIGAPVHVLCRHVLDQARDGVEAMAILSNATMSASSAVTVIADDADGGIVCCVELSPAGPGFVTPDQDGLIAHANHFLADPGRQADTMVREAPDSVLRLDHAARRLRAAAASGPLTEDALRDVLHSHRGGAGGICCHPHPDAAFGDRWQTLATVAVDPAHRSMRLLSGGPCQSQSTEAAARQSLSRQGSAAS